MYVRILVALENGRADDALLPHVSDLARRLGSSLLLVHVADGFAARNFASLKLAESDEIRADRAYLDRRAADLRVAGHAVEVQLAMGEPAREILRVAAEHGCDMIAMGTHGHRFIGDLVHGSTISEVRHKASVPVLLVPGVVRARA
ncbi:MAG: universal stress protein [Verrucomicrobiota bacterium]|jgi:manganese transport protein